MKHDLTASSGRDFLSGVDDTEFLRILYCYGIGSTFVSISRMEEAIITSMTVCDKIQVGKILGSDASTWEKLIQKASTLKDSTLGSLITILSRHGINPQDISYLKWVKVKRDQFIHGTFRDSEWPGDLAEWMFEAHQRHQLCLQIIFDRAATRINKILARAGLIEIINLGEDGILMVNSDMLSEDDLDT